jgi:hypothetical protein
MIENLIDPTVLFFLVGILAGVFRTDLRLPEAIYEILSIYLLLAIGLKGGVQLSTVKISTVVVPSAAAIGLGLIIPVIAYIILRRLGKFNRTDAAAIAAHYGSVSAVTFAVVLTYLDRLHVPYEEFTTVLLVLMEIPAIAVGILIARVRGTQGPISYSKLAHEVFFGKSIYLLISGIIVGYVVGTNGMSTLKLVFVDPFKGALAFFLLEMGLVTSHRLVDLKRTGLFLVLFGIAMPVLSGAMGTAAAWIVGLSVGGTTVLATLAASASYIAAPAAMRIALPEANPTYSLTAVLGVTFPFNLVAGIPLFYWMATAIH